MRCFRADKVFSYGSLSLVLVFPCLSTAQSIIVKANNQLVLTNGASWVNGIVPYTNNIAQWDAVFCLNGTNGIVAPGAGTTAHSWLGVRVTTGATANVTLQATGGNRITLGAAGIDMSQAGANFNFNCGVTLGATQIWEVGTGRTLVFGAPTCNPVNNNTANPKLGIIKTGPGTLEYGQSQLYSGNTEVRAGILLLSANAGVPNGVGKGDLILSNGVMFNMSANDDTINGLWGDGAITNSNTGSNGVSILTLGDGNATGTFTGPIRGNIILRKIGSGTQTLSGVSTYSGGTTISNGMLRINNGAGSGTGTNTLTVIANGALAGTGTITGPVTLNGMISPGDRVGTLTTGSETWNAGARYRLELDSSGGCDALLINGNLDIQATTSTPVTVQVVSLGDTTPGNPWTIVTATGAVQNYAAGKIVLDVSQFKPPTTNSAFAITLRDNTLQVRLIKAGTVLQVK